MTLGWSAWLYSSHWYSLELPYLKTWRFLVRHFCAIQERVLLFLGTGRLHRGCSWIVSCINAYVWPECRTLSSSWWTPCSYGAPNLPASFCYSTWLRATSTEKLRPQHTALILSIWTCPSPTRQFSNTQCIDRQVEDWHRLPIFLWSLHSLCWWIYSGRIHRNL